MRKRSDRGWHLEDARVRVVQRDVANEPIVDVWLEAAVRERGGSGDTAWMCAIRLAQDPRGVPVVGELRVFPSAPNSVDNGNREPGYWGADDRGYRADAPLGGVTVRLLRKLSLGSHGALLARAQQHAESELRRSAHCKGSDQITSAYTWLAAATKKHARPAAPSTRDAHAARLASEYVDLVRAGVRSPVGTIARRLNMPTRIVQAGIRVARRRGLLTAGTPGCPGGVLTPLGRQALSSLTRFGYRPRDSQRRE